MLYCGVFHSFEVFLPRVCIHFHPYLAFTLVVCDTEQPNLPSSIFMTSDIGPGLHLLHDLVKTTFGKVHKNSLQLSLLIVCAKFAQFSIDKLTRSVHLWGSSVSMSLSIAGSCLQGCFDDGNFHQNVLT